MQKNQIKCLKTRLKANYFVEKQTVKNYYNKCIKLEKNIKPTEYLYISFKDMSTTYKIELLHINLNIETL